MTKEERVIKVLDLLEEHYGPVKCYLNHECAWQLLIATILSAQCTDARVNMVTEDLFKKYPSIKAFAEADLSELEQDIRSTGFYHNKAKNIIGCCQMLLSEYGGEVPSDIDKLTKLPEKDYVELCSRLIEKYAEEGDELILSASCRYREKINALPAIKALSLKTGKIASFAGGVILANEKTDKNLTFEALIALEKEKKQAEIAGKLFG